MIKKAIIWLWGSYKAPTPSFWRRVGDAMLAAVVFVETTSLSIPSGMEKLIVVAGITGKFLTNFFAKK